MDTESGKHNEIVQEKLDKLDSLEETYRRKIISISQLITAFSITVGLLLVMLLSTLLNHICVQNKPEVKAEQTIQEAGK